jgi:hypothetical protein
VLYPEADPCWLDFATGLSCLKELRLTAAQLRLQPEGGLACLLPLRGSLAVLRLDGCMLLTDAKAALLAQLRCAEASPCGSLMKATCPPHASKAALPAVSTYGIHVLPAAPPCSGLERLEVTCCQLGQAGVDGLAAALPRLAHVELRLPDGEAGVSSG